MRRTWNVHDRLLYIIEGRRKEKDFRDNRNIATAYEKKSYVKNNMGGHLGWMNGPSVHFQRRPAVPLALCSESRVDILAISAPPLGGGGE